MKKDSTPENQETTEYENCMDLLEEGNGEVTLEDFIEIEGKQEDDNWKKYWTGMPEFVQEEEKKYKSLIVHFMTEEDFKRFCLVIDQDISEKSKFIYFPEKNKDKNALTRWIE